MYTHNKDIFVYIKKVIIFFTNDTIGKILKDVSNSSKQTGLYFKSHD